MPTPDSSQFTQLKRYSVINRSQNTANQQKTSSQLYQTVPSVTRPLNFLASSTNNYTSSPGFTRINVVTAPHAKPKVPGGNIFGQSGSGGGVVSGGGGQVVSGVINITNFTTFNSQTNEYELNSNYTITASQTLNIPLGTIFRIIGGKTLTNSGTLNNAGYIANGGTFNNTGTFNNNRPFYNTNTFNNTGTLNNNVLGVFFNEGGITNNTNRINNTGNSYNEGGSTINNSGFIYTYSGGIFHNRPNSIINNSGTFSVSNGGACGSGRQENFGTINIIGSGIRNTNCPP
jgi:hypothetical protein